MEITEVRVRLVKNRDGRLKAFCSLTFDHEFVVRDIKIIERASGYFIAMPSRKMSDHCNACGGKNSLGARFCNACGRSLPDNRAKTDVRGKAKLHADIAHPINPECRMRIQEKLVVAYERELEKSKDPGYKLVEIDDMDKEIPDTMR